MGIVMHINICIWLCTQRCGYLGMCTNAHSGQSFQILVHYVPDIQLHLSEPGFLHP